MHFSGKQVKVGLMRFASHIKASVNKLHTAIAIRISYQNFGGGYFKDSRRDIPRKPCQMRG